VIEDLSNHGGLPVCRIGAGRFDRGFVATVLTKGFA
jgi:hypothetical protein